MVAIRLYFSKGFGLLFVQKEYVVCYLSKGKRKKTKNITDDKVEETQFYFLHKSECTEVLEMFKYNFLVFSARCFKLLEREREPVTVFIFILKPLGRNKQNNLKETLGILTLGVWSGKTAWKNSLKHAVEKRFCSTLQTKYKETKEF